MRVSRLFPVLAVTLTSVVVIACGGDDGGSKFPGGSESEGEEIQTGTFSTNTLPPSDNDASGGTPGCGNSVIDGDETCDDGNSQGGDGCSSTCTIEPGYTCADVGAACVAAACGDGIVAGDEDCDDGNTDDGEGDTNDGCSSICRLQEGFVCPEANKPCVATVCGDNKKEGTEQCDDGDTKAFDGCSPTCEIEPSCSGGKCSAVCGDGLKFPGEECDDGNTRDGDGCSKTCTLEAGFTCNVVVEEPPVSLDLPIVYRDFLPNGFSGTIPTGYTTHPDFEQYNPGICQGLIEDSLDAENKPVLKDPIHCRDPKKSDDTRRWMTSSDSYSQWYRDDVRNGEDDHHLLVNKRVDATLKLKKRDDGSYVFDSNEAPYSEGRFFPLDQPGGSSNTTFDDKKYGFGIEKGMKDGDNHSRNFHFTSEFKYWFTFKAGSNPKLEFRGDDDVWVFINNHLAVDLGGVHGAAEGSVTLDDTTAGNLGLADGGMYEITVFQAERHTSASNYKLTLRGFEHAHTVCASVCGDGTKTRSEACDDGTANNTGGYGKCNADCTLGARCGDGTMQADQGEECDDGNFVNDDGCSSTCKLVAGGGGPK